MYLQRIMVAFIIFHALTIASRIALTGPDFPKSLQKQ